ncbi:phage tail tape measure protein [Mycobacteroides abscessus]
MPLTLDVLTELDESSLQREIDRAKSQIATAGRDAGRDFNRNFNSSVGQLNIRQATASLQQELESAGREGGNRFANQVTSQIKDAAAEVAGHGRDAAGGFSNAFSDGVSGAPGISGLGEAVAGRMGMAGAGVAAAATFGTAFGAALVAAAALFGSAVADGMATAATVDLFQAKMGLDEESMGRFAKAAGAAYANNFGESLADNLEAAQAALQAGLIGPDAADAEAQRTVEKLQGVGEVTDANAKELARASATLIRAGFADSTSDALDIVTSGFQNGLNVSNDWLDSINKYSGQFRKLGLDSGDMLTLLKEGLEGGASGTGAVADGLKTLSANAVKGTKDTNEAFEGLGFNADEMGRRFAAGGEQARQALGKVLDELRNIDDPMQKALISQRLFGSQWEEMGDAINKLDLDPAKNKFTDLQGTSDRATKTATDNFKSEWEEATKAVSQWFNDLKTSVSDWFVDLPIIRSIPGVIKDVFSAPDPNYGYTNPDVPRNPVQFDPNNPGGLLQPPGGGVNAIGGDGVGLGLGNLLNPTPGAPPPPGSPLAPKPSNATDEGPQAGEHKPIDPTPDKPDKTPPSFDPSLWSVQDNPVAMPPMGVPAMGMGTAGIAGGRGFGPGYWQVDPQRVFDAESGVERAKNNLEQDRIRRLELEAKGNASQRELLSIKNQIQEDERAYISAQMKLADAQQGTWKKQKDATNNFLSALGQIGAALDNDLGASKGLAGLADNLVRFVASLGAAPMMGQLAVIAQANGGIARTGSGLAGFIGQQMGLGQTPVPQGYAAGYLGGSFGGGGMYAGDAALLANVPAGRYETPNEPAVWDLTKGLADCSSAVEDLVNLMDGRPTGGRQMSTANADQWLRSHGFLPGMGGDGDFRVGFNPSHMQATLPGGTNINWGSDNAAAQRGMDGGQGAYDPAFTSHYYRPATGGGTGGGGFMPVAPSVGVTPTPITMPPSGYAPLSDAALANPGLTNPGVPGAGQSGLSPLLAPGGGAGGYGPGGTGPMQGRSYGQGGPGGGGFQGLGGAPMAALSTAASGLDLIAPGAGQGAQIAMQLTNRAIGYAGQLAGIGVSGLLETFALNDSALSDPSKNWIGKIASGIAGARPALPNSAGQSAPPIAPPEKQQNRGQGQQGSAPMVNIEKFENGSGNPSDGQSAARDIARQFNSVGAGER